MYPLLVTLLAAAGIVRAEPQVTFVPIDNPASPGVTAVVPSDPAFPALAENSLPAEALPAFRRVVPCSIVVRNDTSDHIVAIVASVETLDRHGLKSHGTVVVSANVPPSGKFDFLLAPGEQMLLPADSGYAQHAKRLKRQGFESSEAERLDELSRRSLEHYTSAARITFVLDSVLFADGKFVGPDTAGTVARWTHFLSTEQAFDRAALAFQGHPADELRQYFASIGKLRGQGSADARTVAGMARRWERVLERHGMEVLLNSLQADLQRVTDFSIHQ